METGEPGPGLKWQLHFLSTPGFSALELLTFGGWIIVVGAGGGAGPGRCRMLSSNPGLQFSHVSSTVSHPPPPHPPKPSVTTDLAKCPLGGNIDPELRYHPDPFLFFFLIVCLFRAAPAASGGSQARGLIVAVAP